ncbi:MAG: family 1 glycosylhydrolase, partial [Lachnospiraceae bacterium]|nr:family 1 glycosylhydrolase [Lachnospiraceae bacterium]
MNHFLIGAATSAHQVEGNNVNADCWIMENAPGTMWKEPSGAGVDHYNRFREDIDYLAAEGLNAYRFTIEWARIQPEEGMFDESAFLHYQDVIEYCIKKGITPIVTLHHFSTPAWVIKKGGWKSEAIITYFADYCRAVIKRLGDKLKYICTINEANMG